MKRTAFVLSVRSQADAATTLSALIRFGPVATQTKPPATEAPRGFERVGVLPHGEENWCGVSVPDGKDFSTPLSSG